MSLNFRLLPFIMRMRHILFQIYLRKLMVVPAVLRFEFKLILIVGGPPAVALFATNARYKREAYRGSEFAPAILSGYGLKVVMKVGFSVYFIVQLTFSDI